MGLKEYLKAGADLKRDNIILVTDPLSSGSVDLGSAYLLYNIKIDQNCRLRLYDNSASLNDPGEQSRAFGQTSISASTALIGDFTMSAGTYTIDPVLYGISSTPSDRLTYYKIDNAVSAPEITFGRYLLEDALISTSSRVNLPSITENLLPGQLTSGSVALMAVPKTYIFVSASVAGTNVPVRFRLYSKFDTINDATEKNRPFMNEAQTSTLLIDGIFRQTETTHFVPKIIGANLENMGTDLITIKNSFSSLAGKSEMYYIMENLNPNLTDPSDSITVSIHVFSLED